jgi:hypothetical protein
MTNKNARDSLLSFFSFRFAFIIGCKTPKREKRKKLAKGVCHPLRTLERFDSTERESNEI